MALIVFIFFVFMCPCFKLSFQMYGIMLNRPLCDSMGVVFIEDTTLDAGYFWLQIPHGLYPYLLLMSFLLELQDHK